MAERQNRDDRERLQEGKGSPDRTERPLRADSAEPDQRTGEEQTSGRGGNTGSTSRRGPAPTSPGMSAKELEAMNTDGARTGGVGADAGGYGPVPGSEGTG